MSFLAQATLNGLATLDALDVAFPPVNEDGTPNQAARDTAVLTAVVSAGANRIFEMPISASATIADLEKFFLDLLVVIVGYKRATGRRFLPILAV